MNFIKKYKEILFLVVFCILFFCIYSYFNLIVFQPTGEFAVGAPKFSSPDETANYFWIKQFAQGEPLYYFEELNSVANGLIHARSFNAVQGKIVPGSFLGMIFIYGFLAKVFTLKIVPFLTPFFASLGILFFYLLIKKIFKQKNIALISAVLLSFLPPYFYYSCRGMYHSILFISLFIAGSFFLLKALDCKLSALKIFNTKILYYLLSGGLIGLSIITRTSEIVWITIAIFLIFIISLKKINWPGFFLFIIGLLVSSLPLFCYNQILYGQYISAGYQSMMPAGGVAAAVRSGVLFRILVTPFGFNLKSIFTNGFNYLYQFLPYWSVPTVIGGFLFLILPIDLIKINYKKRIIYFFYSLVLIIYLLIFYGSWDIIDRIDQASLSLGTSYLRYWLPIYIAVLPFIATLIWQLSKLVVNFKLKYKNQSQTILANFFSRTAICIIIILSILMPSINLTIRKTDESLFLLNNLSETRLKSNLIKNITNQDDIIVIYKQADKIFFPQRNNLITALVVPPDYKALFRLAKLKNIYYYTYAPPDTVEFIFRRDFEQYGLKIEQGKRVLGSDWIYKINIINE